MNIEEQFNLIAEEYDANRKKFITCFEDYYKSTTKFIASNITEPKRVLDLGAGTGLLSYFWYCHFPASEYVLVDIADDMLNVARKRFAGIDTVSYQVADYGDKEKLFERIYEKLPEGGLFVNYDQFCAGQACMDGWFDSYWESQLTDSGLTKRDIELWKERRKLDRECSVEEEEAMLRKSGFRSVKCVYSYQKFSVIVAVK